MSLGSFKNRISSVVSAATDEAGQAVQTVVSGGTQMIQDTVDLPASGWADKVGLAAGVAGVTDGLAGIPGGLSSNNAPADKPVTVTVQIGGQVLDPKNVFVGMIETRHAVNEIPGATVMLTLPQAAPDDHTALDALLNRCKVGQPATLRADKLTLFNGVVGTVQVKTGESGWQVVVRLKHALQGLKATSRSRVWKAGQDAALVRQILSEHKVRAGTVTLPESEAVQRQQWNCTDWHFVRALLGLHGAWLWPQSDGSVTMRPPTLSGRNHTVSAGSARGGLTVLNAEWGYSGLRQSAGAGVQSWDMSKQAVVKKTAKKIALGDGGLSPSDVKALGLNSEALLTGQWDTTLQQATADGWLSAQHAQAVRVTLTLAGCTAFQPGDTVSLTGFGSHLSGKGLITQVEYQCSQNERMGKTRVSVGLDEDAASPPALPVPAGLITGTVAAYKADPKSKWNRLPVSVPVLGKEVLWARTGHVYASKDSGVTFYPEEGDEVVLAFIGSDPVIVAAVHNPTRAAPFEPSKKNAKKGIVLRHAGQRAGWLTDRDEHTVTLELGDDKKPEQQMVIGKAKGLALTSLKGNVHLTLKEGGMACTVKKDIALKADETITMAAKTGISAGSDKDITLAAKTKLHGTGKTGAGLACEKSTLSMTPEKATLSASQIAHTGSMTVDIKGNEAVNIKSARVSLKGEAGVAVSAAKVDVEGKATVSVSGANVTVKGTAGATIEAGGQLKVAGQMTEVGGAGITSVKGSMVNLG